MDIERYPDDNDPFNAGYNCCFDKAMSEIERLRAIVRVNGLRWGHTHEEIDRILEQTPHDPDEGLPTAADVRGIIPRS